MKTTPTSAHPASLADPRIVKKVRRDHASAALSDGLSGEQDHDYLPPLSVLPQGLRLTDFGRPRL
jgi:hypothetical protein